MEGANNSQFPGFFKVYFPNSSSQMMKLPAAFVQRSPKGSIPKKLYLRNRRGEYWTMTLGSIGNDLFFQGVGWIQFVKDKNLVEGSFLVFYFNGIDTFDCKIFPPNGLEKIDDDDDEVVEEINGAAYKDDYAEEEEEQEKEEEEAEEVSDDEDYANTVEVVEVKDEEGKKGKRKRKGKGKAKKKNFDIYGADIFRSGTYRQPANRYFVTRRRQCREDALYIPVDIVKDLQYELPETLNVRDPRGNTHPLQLNTWADGRIWYRDGWRRICNSNCVSKEDRIICEFIQRGEQQIVEMQIHIVRARNSSY